MACPMDMVCYARITNGHVTWYVNDYVCARSVVIITLDDHAEIARM